MSVVVQWLEKTRPELEVVEETVRLLRAGGKITYCGVRSLGSGSH